MGILVRLGRPLRVNEHDDEQIEQDDAAGVHQDLDRGEKLRAQHHVQRRDEQEIEYEKQHAVHGVLRGDHQHGEPENARRDEIKDDGLEHYRSTTLTIPVTTRFTMASGMSTFHPSRISWSYL